MPSEFKSFFKSVGGNEGNLCLYNTRLDTYGKGCAHNCSYCYARSLLSFRKMWNIEDPAVANPDAIRKKIESLKNHNFQGVLRLGGMTDCFQPAEAREKVTKATIQMLNEARIPYLVVTKSHLVSTSEYSEVMDRDLAHVQISITNTDDKAALEYEKCSLTSKRIEAILILQDKGFDVGLRLSPFISGWIDPEKIRGIDKILVEFLRVNHWIEKWLNGLVDLSGYTLKSGGYRHLPLEVKCENIKELMNSLPGVEFSVCEDVPAHYDYWKTMVNHNPLDCCNLRGVQKNPLKD